MIEYCRVRGASRGRVSPSVAFLFGALLLAGCADVKQMVGIDEPMPDEFAVEIAGAVDDPARLQPAPAGAGCGAPPGAEQRTAGRAALEQAGPGGPGSKQAADLRLHSAENGLPNIGGGGQAPDASAMVGSQSLSNKLLDYGDTGNAGATVDQHATTPLKGVY